MKGCLFDTASGLLRNKFAVSSVLLRSFFLLRISEEELKRILKYEGGGE
jgi:hypothetical protein